MRLCLLSLLLTCWSPAFGSTLWAVDTSGSVSHLWQIDTATGAATQVVTLATTTGAGDITVLNGTIYGGSGSSGFSTIDPVTGVFTSINGADPIQGLAADPSIPLFYEDGNVGFELNRILPDGSRTIIGGGGANDFITDLAYDPVHGVLYGWSNVVLLETIDPATGTATPAPSKSFAVSRLNGAIGYDGANNTLYFLNDGDENLYSLNTTTGAPTLIGPTGLTGVTFTGLSDLSVPEPSSASLIAIGLGAFALARQQRRQR